MMSRPARPRAAAYRLILEYEGTRFHGWQRQGPGQTEAGIRTVAGTLERILAKAGHAPRVLVGAGRTDAGVHALGQVAHLHLDAPGPRPEDLQILLDQALPSDLAVASIERCAAEFHARHDALERTYLYRISRRRSGLAKPFLWWVKGHLNEGRVQEAWAAFEGFHNVSAYADLEANEDPRCELRRCSWTEVGSLLLLRVTASHFKTRQVRRMVGAAVACGQGKAKVADLRRDLERPSPEAVLRWSALAAPAAGLFLERVRYRGEPESAEAAFPLP